MEDLEAKEYQAEIRALNIKHGIYSGLVMVSCMTGAYVVTILHERPLKILISVCGIIALAFVGRSYNRGYRVIESKYTRTL